jgi:hypothetical protein
MGMEFGPERFHNFLSLPGGRPTCRNPSVANSPDQRWSDVHKEPPNTHPPIGAKARLSKKSNRSFMTIIFTSYSNSLARAPALLSPPEDVVRGCPQLP